MSSRRPVALTANTWWNVNPRSSDDESNPTDEGATPLVERCMRMYGWNVSFALRVLKGYKQFIELKKRSKDWNATSLSPSIPIDRMWHSHLLDNKGYYKFCNIICGQQIYHNPDGGNDMSARTTRIASTKVALSVLFGDDGDVDEEVWDFGDHSGGGSATAPHEERGRTTSANNASDRERSRSRESECTITPIPDSRSTPSCSESITLQIRKNYKEQTYFKIRVDTPLERIFEVYATREGVDPDDLRFLLDGERIVGQLTARYLELIDGDIIDVMPEQGGC